MGSRPAVYALVLCDEVSGGMNYPRRRLLPGGMDAAFSNYYHPSLHRISHLACLMYILGSRMLDSQLHGRVSNSRLLSGIGLPTDLAPRTRLCSKFQLRVTALREAPSHAADRLAGMDGVPARRTVVPSSLKGTYLIGSGFSSSNTSMRQEGKRLARYSTWTHRQ